MTAKRMVLAAAALTATMIPAEAADSFRQLKGSEIKARFAGTELTDEAHWAYVFGRDGRTTSFSLGKQGSGTWRVGKDELLRREDAIPEEGVLQKPEKRQ